MTSNDDASYRNMDDGRQAILWDLYRTSNGYHMELWQTKLTAGRLMYKPQRKTARGAAKR